MGIRLCIEQFWPSENEGGYDGHWIYQFELQVLINQRWIRTGLSIRLRSDLREYHRGALFPFNPPDP